MPKAHSTHYRRRTRAGAGEEPVYLLEITHPQLAVPVRLVNDTDNLRWRENQFAWSEAVDNPYWNKSAVVTANNALGIDGANSAETVEDDNGAGWETVSKGGLERKAVGAPVWTALHVLKDAIDPAQRFGLVRLGFTGAPLNSQYVDLRFATSTGAILATPQGPGAIVVAAAAEDAGTHWRFWIAGYTNDAGWLTSSVELYPAVGAHAALGAYSNAVQGSMAVTGFQFGQGAEPTPYVKTEAAPLPLEAGGIFVACPFRVRMPDDTAQTLPRVPLSIDNIGRELTKWLEASDGGRGAQLRLMEVMRDTPDVIEQEYTLDLLNVRQGMLEVVGQLGYENVLDQPALPATYTPETAPGLF